MLTTGASVVRRDGPVVGETRMAQAIRAHGWESTLLGSIDTWSDTLLAQVNLMLCSPYPTIVAWGEELTMLCNDPCVEAIGERHDLTVGRPYREVFRDIEGPFLIFDIEACLRCGKTARKQNVPIFYPKPGAAGDRYWNYSMIPIHESGQVAGVFQLFQDTTASVLTKLKLVQERADLDSLFEDAPIFMALYEGPEHVYRMVNHSYERMLGPRRYVGLRVIDVFPEAAEQGFVAKLDEVYHTGKTYTASNERFTKQATTDQPQKDIYVDLIYHPRRNVEGEVCGIIEMGTDVTDRRLVQQALIESEKVAAVGRLVSSIAHEINNPLASAVNYLYLAEMSETVDEVRRYLAIADGELKRVSAISNQTLLSQKQDTDMRHISFQEMVDSILPLYNRPIWKAKIAVEVRYLSREPICCSEGEIRQVISNLIANAIDAMVVGGGRLIVRARVAMDWCAGELADKLTVADTGDGIAPESLPHIFRAFFTTKGFAGNGLGLWVCREIVTRHKGSLSVRSRQGMGSVFTLYLPRRQG